MKDQLIFDTTDVDTISDTDSVGAYVRSGDAGALITHHSPAEAGSVVFGFADGDVTVGTDVINEVAHGLSTGSIVQLTSTGVLPTGLALATDYHVIRVDADNFKLAASAIDAEQGTAVDITVAAGGGVHTVTEQERERRALDVWMMNEIDVNLTQSDEVTVFQGTSPWVVSGEVSLDAATLAALETVTVEQGTSPWVVSGTVNSVQSGTWTVGLSEDHDYGVVGAATLRTAAQIGNATGAADFDTGVTTAQTLRVTLATDTSLDINDAALANVAIASAANPLSVANTAEDVVAAPLADRKYLSIYNFGNRKIFVGASGVTAATGFPLSPGSYIEMRAGDAVDVEWVGPNTDQEIRTMELS